MRRWLRASWVYTIGLMSAQVAKLGILNFTYGSGNVQGLWSKKRGPIPEILSDAQWLTNGVMCAKLCPLQKISGRRWQPWLVWRHMVCLRSFCLQRTDIGASLAPVNTSASDVAPGTLRQIRRLRARQYTCCTHETKAQRLAWNSRRLRSTISFSCLFN